MAGLSKTRENFFAAPALPYLSMAGFTSGDMKRHGIMAVTCHTDESSPWENRWGINKTLKIGTIAAWFLIVPLLFSAKKKRATFTIS